MALIPLSDRTAEIPSECSSSFSDLSSHRRRQQGYLSRGRRYLSSAETFGTDRTIAWIESSHVFATGFIPPVSRSARSFGRSGLLVFSGRLPGSHAFPEFAGAGPACGRIGGEAHERETASAADADHPTLSLQHAQLDCCVGLR